MLPERIETDRLELTALTPENVDVLAYYDICSGNAGDDIDAVTEHLPWEPHDTPKETKEFLDRLADQRAAGENAEFLVRPKGGDEGPDDDRIAGTVGLAPHWDRRTGELGIWLREPFWGRGYYDEAFAELARVAFERLDLDAVEIVHRHGNANSRRATEKFVERFGGRHEGRLRNYWTGPGGPADAHRYTVARDEYGANAEADR
ncbi:GNAT family N-acetyltransferase [Halorussus gelatinilyticus]|uniref:GNAT family N-acetyltransferase n=1 Tax=Halorussus gelatinilyticus TaxID=2937524 RepID=A0A8U0IKX6_9EURY|nr:GNAT family N-acetyltransferase [Halorussus gelatinilyticus]UPW00854.1 GNAT family N-acetyltransferase [Halorussus gelatinilyticus]